MNSKQRAAEAALALVQNDMTVGLGTGSTADQFIQALAAALRDGKLTNVRGIPTSLQSERRANELGVPLVTLDAHHKPDITIDGADEVAPNLDLIKGLGGALLREKIVAQNSKRLVIIGDAGKAVPVLGTRSPLPVEVAPFGYESHEPFLRSLGAEVTLRRTADGSRPFVTDNGNYIYDCRFGPIADPARLEERILHRAGIFDCGLFLGMAHVAILADEKRVRTIQR